MGIEQLRSKFEHLDRDLVTLRTGVLEPEEVSAVARDGKPARHGSRPARGNARRAAVLILISEPGGDVVLTERAATLRSHPSQVAFPGGGLEEGERAVDAALREAQEEVGLDPALVDVFGALPPSHVNASSFDVTAILGSWDGAGTVAVVDPGEVAAVHRVAVEELADPASRFTATLPVGYRGPAFSAGGLFVGGFTAHLLNDVLEMGGWTRPWDTEHEIEVPAYLWRD